MIDDREADISIAGLSLWVESSGHHDGSDSWDDSGWLVARAICIGQGSRVEVTGSFLHVQDLKSWLDPLSLLIAGSQTDATFETLDQHLRLSVRRTDDLGHLALSVEISADPSSELHRLRFEIDQSYLRVFQANLQAVLRAL